MKNEGKCTVNPFFYTTLVKGILSRAEKNGLKVSFSENGIVLSNRDLGLNASINPYNYSENKRGSYMKKKEFFSLPAGAIVYAVEQGGNSFPLKGVVEDDSFLGKSVNVSGKRISFDEAKILPHVG